MVACDKKDTFGTVVGGGNVAGGRVSVEEKVDFVVAVVEKPSKRWIVVVVDSRRKLQSLAECCCCCMLRRENCFGLSHLVCGS